MTFKDQEVIYLGARHYKGTSKKNGAPYDLYSVKFLKDGSVVESTVSAERMSERVKMLLDEASEEKADVNDTVTIDITIVPEKIKGSEYTAKFYIA